MNVFQTLSKIDVSEHTEKKGKFTLTRNDGLMTSSFEVIERIFSFTRILVSV